MGIGILVRDPWRIPLGIWRYDVMILAMEPMGHAGALARHPYYGTWKSTKLTEAERFFKIRREGKPQRALSDAKATLEILKAIRGDDSRRR